jgi:hypothetical protein
MIDDTAGDREGILVVFGQVVGHAAQPAVHLGAAERFDVDHFTRGGEDQLRAAEEHGALLANDHDFVAKRGDVGATGGGRTMDERDLRDAFRRHLHLVEHDGAGLALVGKDVRQVRQEAAAGLDHRDAGHANSWARVWRLVVMPNIVPPLTVASLTSSMHQRPQTFPTPVIMVAPGGTPSYMSAPASCPSSKKGDPGSSRAVMRSRGSICPRLLCSLRAFSDPPASASFCRSRKVARRPAWSPEAAGPSWGFMMVVVA